MYKVQTPFLGKFNFSFIFSFHYRALNCSLKLNKNNQIIKDLNNRNSPFLQYKLDLKLRSFILKAYTQTDTQTHIFSHVHSNEHQRTLTDIHNPIKERINIIRIYILLNMAMKGQAFLSNSLAIKYTVYFTHNIYNFLIDNFLLTKYRCKHNHKPKKK